MNRQEALIQRLTRRMDQRSLERMEERGETPVTANIVNGEPPEVVERDVEGKPKAYRLNSYFYTFQKMRDDKVSIQKISEKLDISKSTVIKIFKERDKTVVRHDIFKKIQGEVNE